MSCKKRVGLDREEEGRPFLRGDKMRTCTVGACSSWVRKARCFGVKKRVLKGKKSRRISKTIIIIVSSSSSSIGKHAVAQPLSRRVCHHNEHVCMQALASHTNHICYASLLQVGHAHELSHTLTLKSTGRHPSQAKLRKRSQVPPPLPS
mmetsp:Transcript_17620/g.49140  ORF Transcript_17620/g.49140 Transcript_17620/m.49140 type:complete len:149 (-) Transcript_17620:2157-2603(-)